ncbi:hypothetical protein [Hymenobacter sp. HDW8]|uniref:hypothetical protein n=1 Tax=Hymenobacter sp. HDW8 TaxID=2714932 RepID=UPI00196B26DA|nr:hypothetical protein [Hymenobacter sp. HDW8]
MVSVLNPQLSSVSNLAAASVDTKLKRGIWLYFILIIFEGALRKWVLPELATPLLIIRDPVALWLVAKAWQRGLLPPHPYLIGIVLIGVVGIFTAMLLGHGNLTVALYGARILLLHFPLMFVIGRLFTRDDVIKLGEVTLWIAIGMTILITLQFYSPQSAWVNRGVGGDLAGAGFNGALGYSRPPGTFSFTTGNTLFFSFVAPFVVYFWLNPGAISKWILIAATMGLIAAIPLSISRKLFFSVGVTLIFTLIAISRKPKYTGRIIGAAFGLLVAFAVLSQTDFFQTAMGAFLSRLEAANAIEGGIEGVILDRYVGNKVGAITDAAAGQLPFWGYGLGLGTNVGSKLMTGGSGFMIAEGEWARLLGEMGPLLGIIIIFIRLSFSAKIALACYRKLGQGDLLPWLLLSFGLLILPQGQWAQPTSLGFSTLIGGVILASMRVPPSMGKDTRQARGAHPGSSPSLRGEPITVV